MNPEIIQKLANIYNTLNQIEVKGYENVSFMMGCLNTLNDIIKELNKPAETT
jgi:hypothetical protein